MSSARWTGALLATALGCCAFTATSAYATALFLWSGVTPSLFLSVGGAPQLFETEKVDIECETLKLDGTITASSIAGIRSRGRFGVCETFTGFSALTPSETEFEWTATEGIKVRDFIEFEVQGPVNCKIDFLPEIGTEHKLVSYTNTRLAVLALANVTGLEYEVVGGEGRCGRTGVIHSNGKYRGLVRLSSTEASGTFGWDP